MEERIRANVRWECLEPFLSRVKPRDTIYSTNEFQQLIRYERSRSDRVRSAFSVAVFDIGQYNGNCNGNGNGNGRAIPHSPKALVAGVKSAVRATDHVGWYSCRKIGVILPDTTEEQAMMFTAKVQGRISEHLDPACTQVYSYQDGWLKRGAQNSDNGNGNGNGNGKGYIENIDRFCPLDRSERWSPSEPLEDVLARKMPAWKRILDVAVSVAALFALAPVFLMVGIYIKLASPGPIVF